MNASIDQAAICLGTATLMGASIGFERQWRQRMAGLRTNTLVAIGAASFVVFAGLFPDEGSPTRVAAQVVSGIGFLGAGIIFREGLHVTGLNTAATLWCSAAVGLLAGSGHPLHAALATALVVLVNLTLRLLVRSRRRKPTCVRVVCRSPEEAHVRALLLQSTGSGQLSLRRLDSTDLEESGRVEVVAQLTSQSKSDTALEQVVGRLSLEPTVSAASWSVGPVLEWESSIGQRAYKNRHGAVMIRVHVIGCSAGIFLAASQAMAADLRPNSPVKAPVRSIVYDWTGFYLGGHVGYGSGSFGPDTNPVPLQGVFLPHSVTGLIGGYQAGYNRQLANKVVLGVETDISFGSPTDIPRLVPAPFDTTIDYIATARGRAGYAMGTWMPYLTGGVAWGSTHVSLNDLGAIVPPKRYLTHAGWTAGLGIEVAVGGNWTARAEYDYIDLARRTYELTDIGLPRVNVDPNIHLFKLGLNYRLWETPPWTGPAPVDGRTALAEPANWNVHAQTTVIAQAYPRMRSPYEGTNSLPGGGQGRETWTADAFLGWRLWQGGEFYFNPELAQGFGLNSTLGLAGFPNGEAQKGGAAYPRFRPQRYIFRQTFGLGGEQEDVADGPMQLAGKRDIDRVTVTVGRFAVGDYFDGNSYAKDPRLDFMNWAMWASAAYDFPADLPGFTRGAVVELNRKDWALRAGLFQVPNAPNSDVLVFKTGGALVEFEERHAIFDQPGKLRLGVFANRGNTGNYRDALAITAADPALDINNVIVAIQRDNPKHGFYVNAEQQVMKDVGVFARASWNDGQNQILSFTDIDRSISGGLSVKGSYWGRPSDTIGIGGAVNGLSAAHSDFLAAGGLGLLIGDGRLNYRHERIFETYYAYALDKNFTATADYQFISNPAYNADRGPVHIFSGRLHGEF